MMLQRSLLLLATLCLAACGQAEERQAASRSRAASVPRGSRRPTSPTPHRPSQNLLANPGFEDGAGLGAAWRVYPPEQTNWAVLARGAPMYPDDHPFEPHDGERSLKLYGAHTGAANEVAVYQEVPADPEDTLTLSGWAYVYEADAITADRTSARLEIRFFDDDYTFLGATASEERVDADTAPNSWSRLSVTATAPARTTRAQATLVFTHCEGAETDCHDGGGVYVDDVSFVRGAAPASSPEG